MKALEFPRGLDNGNTIDHTPMKSNKRNTFNGLAMAVIQSDNQTGVIRVRTNSSSLKNTSIEIVARKPATRIATVENSKK